MILRRIFALAVAAALAIGGLVVAGAPASAVSTSALSMLSALWVEPENTSAYDRSSFADWIDADGNGCDTRAEVLRAESTAPTDGGCPVKTGSWTSYYDGVTWTLASDVDIDHMVPLSEAWDSGAQNWNPEQRKQYANDLAWAPSLVAVTDNVNQSKGDRDPAEWMPPLASAQCRYVGEWITVKHRWNLSVDPTERDALASQLTGSCAGLSVAVPAKGGTPEPVNEVGAYITQVYNDLFNRNPDPTGLATWTAKLRSGTSYGQVANGITYSNEYRSSMIRAAYVKYLDREPDPAGAANWLRAMQNGMHIEQMQGGFISSAEYYAKAGGTDRGWINRLYEKVLGRSPASSEVDHWQAQLNNGSNRSAVARGFLYSTEHLTTVVDGYYQTLLRRGIDPAGRQTWVTKIQGGARDEQIIASIVSSAEYRAKVTA